jgi:hypothetical protein
MWPAILLMSALVKTGEEFLQQDAQARQSNSEKTSS